MKNQLEHLLTDAIRIEGLIRVLQTRPDDNEAKEALDKTYREFADKYFTLFEAKSNDVETIVEESDKSALQESIEEPVEEPTVIVADEDDNAEEDIEPIAFEGDETENDAEDEAIEDSEEELSIETAEPAEMLSIVEIEEEPEEAVAESIDFEMESSEENITEESEDKGQIEDVEMTFNVPLLDDDTKDAEDKAGLSDNTEEIVADYEYMNAVSQDIRVDEMLRRQEARDLSKAFTLNDKYRFRRALFHNSDVEFVDTINMLMAMKSYDEAHEYLTEDLSLNPKDMDVADFMDIVKGHFSQH